MTEAFEENLREELGDEEVDALIELGKQIQQTDEVWLKQKLSVYKPLVDKLWK